MKKENTNKRLNKKEKAEIERKELEAKLLEKYVEGESNIDYDKIDANDIWELACSVGSSIEEKEAILGKPLSLISQQQWLEREIAKLKAKRPKEPPSYKVQDPVDVVMKYRFKFVEKIKDFQPQVALPNNSKKLHKSA